MAGRLAGAGHKVLLLERNCEVAGKSCCTGIVSRECVETFPLCREAIVMAANAATVFAPGGKHFRLEREIAPAYILDRARLDAGSVRHAQESGAELVLGARVRRVTLSESSALVRADVAGRQASFQGKMVVMASGFGSKLLQGLGFGRCQDFAVGAQAEVDSCGVDEVEVYLGRDVAPGFFAWVVPITEGKALVGLLCRRGTSLHLRRFFSRLVEQGKLTDAVPRIHFGGVPLRPAPRSYADRLLIVGDAAGQVKPTTGGGIYYGLLCADLAADAIDEAIQRDSFSAATLAVYDRKWKKLLGRELRIGRWARSVYERLGDGQIEGLLETAHERRILESLTRSPDFSFDWHSKLVVRGLKRFGPRTAFTLLRGRRLVLPE